jgi:hypothetical protein
MTHSTKVAAVVAAGVSDEGDDFVALSSILRYHQDLQVGQFGPGGQQIGLNRRQSTLQPIEFGHDVVTGHGESLAALTGRCQR